MSRLYDTVVNAAQIWSEYESCLEVHARMGIEDQTVRAYRFYEGDQWYGLESQNEELPVYNFIAPLVKYKTAMVAMNDMSISFSAPLAKERMQRVCAQLSRLAAQQWERLKMDTKCWDVVKASMIAGDSFVYFYDGSGSCQVLERTDVFLGDESNPDISSQPYIIIRERRPVEDIRREAVKNGLSKEIAMTVMPDEDSEDYGKNKCISLLKLTLIDGNLHFSRSSKSVVYQPEQVIEGLDCYPVAAFVSSRKRGSFRGAGEVTPLIPNQIEINRNLARRIVNAKLTAYSRLIYAGDRIANPKALTEVGTAIEVEGGSVNSVKDAVNYLTPSPMAPDAKALSEELLITSRQLAGAGDASLGSIDPTKASGTAIIAVRDQAAIPLNEQTAAFKRLTEDIARIWYRQWVVYNPSGISLPDGTNVSAGELDLLEPQIRVDVSSTNPFSKYAREQSLSQLFSMGHISFEEYVSALDDESSVPKSKLEQIIKSRGGKQDVGNQN